MLRSEIPFLMDLYKERLTCIVIRGSLTGRRHVDENL